MDSGLSALSDVTIFASTPAGVLTLRTIARLKHDGV